MVAVIDERLGATSQQSGRTQRRFPWSLRGYRRSAVDQHITELERELSELDRELVELRAAATLREEVANEMRRIGEETAGVLIEAHQQRETIVRAAEAEAQRLVAGATSRATAIAGENETLVRDLTEQHQVAHQERDRLLENALAAAAAITDIVHAAYRQLPPITSQETSEVGGESHEGVEAEPSRGEAASYIG